MRIEINNPSRTFTFEVYGDLEDIVIIRQYLEKLPNLLVVRRDDSIFITCPLLIYNNVINILQDFEKDKY